MCFGRLYPSCYAFMPGQRSMLGQFSAKYTNFVLISKSRNEHLNFYLSRSIKEASEENFTEAKEKCWEDMLEGKYN